MEQQQLEQPHATALAEQGNMNDIDDGERDGQVLDMKQVAAEQVEALAAAERSWGDDTAGADAAAGDGSELAAVNASGSNQLRGNLHQLWGTGPSPYHEALIKCQDLACLTMAARKRRYPGQRLFPTFFIVGWQVRARNETLGLSEGTAAAAGPLCWCWPSPGACPSACRKVRPRPSIGTCANINKCWQRTPRSLSSFQSNAISGPQAAPSFCSPSTFVEWVLCAACALTTLTNATWLGRDVPVWHATDPMLHKYPYRCCGYQRCCKVTWWLHQQRHPHTMAAMGSF